MTDQHFTRALYTHGKNWQGFSPKAPQTTMVSGFVGLAFSPLRAPAVTRAIFGQDSLL